MRGLRGRVRFTGGLARRMGFTIGLGGVTLRLPSAIVRGFRRRSGIGRGVGGIGSAMAGGFRVATGIVRGGAGMICLLSGRPGGKRRFAGVVGRLVMARVRICRRAICVLGRIGGSLRQVDDMGRLGSSLAGGVVRGLLVGVGSFGCFRGMLRRFCSLLGELCGKRLELGDGLSGHG